MRLKRYLFATALTFGVLAFATFGATHASAQFGLNEAANGTNIPQTKDLAQIIGGILRAALGLVGTLFLLLMIYAGFKWMTARGDEKHVKEAKDLIMGAVIGMVIIAGAYALTGFVLNAVTGAATESSSSSGGGDSVPITDGGSDECEERSCTRASNCSVAGSSCYTGSCECFGAGDPEYGDSTTPCSAGFCTLL